MGRTCVTLSLDEETLLVWKRLPSRQRSAKVRDYLRASSTVLTDGEGETSSLVSAPSKVHEKSHENVNLNENAAYWLAKIPENPKQKPVVEKRDTGFDSFDLLGYGSGYRVRERVRGKTVDLTDECDMTDEKEVDWD